MDLIYRYIEIHTFHRSAKRARKSLDKSSKESDQDKLVMAKVRGQFLKVRRSECTSPLPSLLPSSFPSWFLGFPKDYDTFMKDSRG